VSFIRISGTGHCPSSLGHSKNTDEDDASGVREEEKEREVE